MKQFLRAPAFKAICLFWYTTILISKLNGLSHVLGLSVITKYSFGTGYTFGYKAGYITSIAVWAAAIIVTSVKLVKDPNRKALSFVKR